MNTKNILALALGLGAAALASAAIAADLPARITKAPPLAPVASWTGFYVGVNGGGAWMDGPSMTYTDLATDAYFPSTVNASTSGALAGFHAGYNWQFAPNWVLGIEGDWDWTNLSADGTNRLVCAGPTRPQCGGINVLFTDNTSLETKVNWLASVRGRLGYASNQWLLYVTGGVAFADLDFNAQVHCTNVPPSFCIGIGQDIRTQFSDTRVGGVIGGGVEFKPASNWTLGAEYLYYRFDGASKAGGSWFFTNGAPAPFFECTVAGQNCARFSFGDFALQTGRVRLSYKFGP